MKYVICVTLFNNSVTFTIKTPSPLYSVFYLLKGIYILFTNQISFSIFVTNFMNMNTEHLLTVLLIGAIAGWLAGNIRQGYGFGLVGNIIVGILGAFIGGWVSRETGFFLGAGLLGTILTAVMGALLLLFLIGLVRPQRM